MTNIEIDLEKQLKRQISIANILSETIYHYNYYFQTKLGCVAPHWKKSNTKHYCFIPSAANSAVDYIMFARSYLSTKANSATRYKFLDCGCGIGNIIIMAAKVGFDATGLEYEADTFALAKDMLLDGCIGVWGHPYFSPKVIRGDILHFQHYKDYDVIYYFAPIKDQELGKRFVKKLITDAKVGALILAYGGEDILSTDSRLNNIEGRLGIYEKIGE